MVRTNLAVDDNVADGLSREAMKRNKTIYAFTNETIEAAIKVYNDGGNPGELYHSWKFDRMMKDLDAIPLPGDLVEKMIKKLYELEKEWLLSVWFAEGSRMGTYLQMSYPQIEELTSAARELQELLPVKRAEIRKVETDGKTRLMMSVIGAGLSQESTDCAAQLMRGIISSYSWKIVHSKQSPGMIEMEVAHDQGTARS